jgi:hypothetical protein
LPDQQLRPGAPATPVTQRLPAITRNKFGLFPVRSPLLGESLLLSLPAGTEMFHFPALPPTALCIQAGATVHDDGRVSPFGNPRINARLPAPRGLSQAPTSFIGSWCQDIHRVLLETWLKSHKDRIFKRSGVLDARVHCAVLKIRTEPQRTRHPIRDAVRLGRSSQPALSEAAASSGPNSVLGAPAPARPRSAAVPENRAY